MLSTLLFAAAAYAGELTTNAVNILNAPKWLTAARVNRVSDQVERVLEWDIRRARVRFYNDEKEFQRAVALPGDTSSVLAVSKRGENAVFIGPRVTTENFDGVFGHELAHIVMFQKYKDAIPAWLEEGLANYAAKRGVIDYRLLASRQNVDVRALTHPFAATGADPKYHYMASSALIEMLAAKCSLSDLLQLSVGQGLESYLATFCRIPDLNASFAQWVTLKSAKTKALSKTSRR